MALVKPWAHSLAYSRRTINAGQKEDTGERRWGGKEGEGQGSVTGHSHGDSPPLETSQ